MQSSRSSTSRTPKPEAIRKLTERPAHKRLIIYGDPGSGKTVLLGSAPRTLILNADGTDAPESARIRYPENAEVWDIGGYDDLDDSYTYLRRSRCREYDWVWFDGITLFQELGMDDIMKVVIRKRPDRDPDVPDVKEYLKNQNRLGKWVRHMTKLPVNFGMTAHVMRVEDSEDGEVTYMPAITGGGKVPLTSKMCGYVGIVGRLHVVTRKLEGGKTKDIRVLQTARSGKWYAKDRFDALGSRVIEPTLPKIEALIDRRKGGAS